MDSEWWIGQPGVPVILRGRTADEVRGMLQPQTAREEFLLAKLEETHEKMLAAVLLASDFDDSDDEESWRLKLSLSERAEKAERDLARWQERANTAIRIAGDAIAAQGMVASQTDRFQLIINKLAELSALRQR